MTTTPDLGIPELAQSQANPDITHNEALVLIQALLNGVINRTTETPPVSPTEGDAYIIGDGSPAASGAWTGRANSIAIFWGGSWRFVPGNDDDGTPITMGARQEGLSVWVRDEEQFVVWSGSPQAWTAGLPVPLTASDIANVPAGGIAATNVQAALNELDTDKVDIVGDTMTGQLIITGTAVGFSPLRLINVENGATNGPVFDTFRDSASPAINDQIGGVRLRGRDNAASEQNYVSLAAIILDPIAASRAGRFSISVADGGNTHPVAFFENRSMNYATLNQQGNGTVNWLAYYVNNNVVIDTDRVFRNRIFTVATLPANASGKRTMVSDALAPAFGAAVAGGGAVMIPVFSTAAAWNVG